MKRINIHILGLMNNAILMINVSRAIETEFPHWVIGVSGGRVQNMIIVITRCPRCYYILFSLVYMLAERTPCSSNIGYRQVSVSIWMVDT